MSPEKSQHSAGWYAGALVFWLLSAWLITVGLSSIIPQIFWPAGEEQSANEACRPTLRTLRRELLDRATTSIAHAPAPRDGASERDALLSWFEQWDQRLFRVRPSCREDDERAAWTELGRLRHGMQALIERFEREEAPRIERLDQLLGKLDEARAQALKHETSHE